MKIGIMGAGGIATVMAKTINAVKGATLYAIGSRTLEKAQMFKKEYGVIKAYGSYEELVKDKDVELIYIATPHSEHFSNMKLCIENGKNIICEKAFTINKEEALEIQKLAKENNVYVQEALWTRYVPLTAKLKEIIDEGLIGEIDSLTANLCYNIQNVERIKNPELAGGALLDIGIYGLNFATTCFGFDIESIDTVVKKMESGVDGKEVNILNYKNGRTAILTHSVYSISDRKGIIYGSNGYIIVENINNYESISVYNGRSNELVRRIEKEPQITGFEYELMEAIECIKNKRIESYSLSLSDSIKLMGIMDSIREKWNFKYPREIRGEKR